MFHLSAFASAGAGQSLGGYQVTIDEQIVFMEREANPVDELAIETNITASAAPGAHRLRLTVFGGGTDDVPGLKFEIPDPGVLGACDLLSRSPDWVCLAPPAHPRGGSPFVPGTEAQPQDQENKDPGLASDYVRYRQLYADNLRNLEAGTTEAFAIDQAGNIYVAAHSFASIAVRKYDPGGTALIYSEIVRSCSGGFLAITGLVVDSAGHAWISGYTNACLPTTAGAYQKQISDKQEHGFVLRLNTGGGSDSSPGFLTYVAGPGQDRITGIRVDAAGNVYVVGNSTSGGFPHQSSFGSRVAGSHQEREITFAAMLDPTGSRLVWSTLLYGGLANALALDPSGNVYVAGQSASPDFPVSENLVTASPGLHNCAGEPRTRESCYRGFVAKLTDRGARLGYSVTFGGRGQSTARGIAVDRTDSRAYVVGETDSPEFPPGGKAGLRAGSGTGSGAISEFLMVLASEGAPVSSTRLGRHSGYAGGIAATVPALDAFVQASGSTRSNGR